ncbi:MAG: DUF1549 domain-containing protein [Planctomycetaceae bacterium]|nr:DUF1549 domain-containing protein [Planctomycetaceae bacterium]
MRFITAITAFGVLLLVVSLVDYAGKVETPVSAPPSASATAESDLKPAVARLDQWFENYWKSERVTPSTPTDDLTVLRRLSLALFGTVPSLEEIRAFENDSAPDRLDRWLVQMLKDARYGDYFSDRLSRSLVGVDQGPFIVFRRDQFNLWLSRQLQTDASWSQMTRDMIAAKGVWTDRPAANFITIARVNDEGLDVNKLAGRTVRTFLGQRIDCAQCHDHPFDKRWHQGDFEGLAAWYSHAGLSLAGVKEHEKNKDGTPVVYKVVDPGKAPEEARVINPAVPFHPEWLPAEGDQRERLAAWVTHPDNRRFERAIANRIWGLMFGRPLHEPVDDLPHPEDKPEDALDILGQEFRARGDKLSVLIRMIAQSKAFRLSSESTAETDSQYSAQESAWAVYPLIRLRPEQVIGSIFQASHIRSVDQNSNPFIRFARFNNENDFINEYGDLGDDELLQQIGTIPQALLRMNGKFTSEQSKVDYLFLSGPAEILTFSKDDAHVVENSFLCCLSRRPTEAELEYYLNLLKQPEEDEPTPSGTVRPSRAEVVQDLFWTLYNSPEFSWNH